MKPPKTLSLDAHFYLLLSRPFELCVVVCLLIAGWASICRPVVIIIVIFNESPSNSGYQRQQIMSVLLCDCSRRRRSKSLADHDPSRGLFVVQSSPHHRVVCGRHQACKE